MIRPLLISLAVFVGACSGAPTPERRSAAHVEDSELAFTPRELAKLDDALLEQIRQPHAAAIPVHVFFRSRPRPEDLAELMLRPYGESFIGQVPKQILKRIVARDDVDHVSMLTDTGYRG